MLVLVALGSHGPHLPGTRALNDYKNQWKPDFYGQLTHLRREDARESINQNSV